MRLQSISAINSFRINLSNLRKQTCSNPIQSNNQTSSNLNNYYNNYNNISFSGLSKKPKKDAPIEEVVQYVLENSDEEYDDIFELAQSPKDYIKATKELLPKQRFELLKMKCEDENNCPLASDLIDNSYDDDYYNIATKGLSTEQKLDLIKTQDNYGCSVAHTLAYNSTAEDNFYKTATQDFPFEEKWKLLNLKDNSGESVAHYLIDFSRDADAYLETIQIFPSEYKYDSLKIKDNDGDSVAHKFALVDPERFASYLSYSFYPIQINNLLAMTNNNSQTVCDRYLASTLFHLTAFNHGQEEKIRKFINNLVKETNENNSLHN